MGISGCATDIPYVPPKEGEITTLKFVNNSVRDLKVKIYKESKNCTAPRDLPVVKPGYSVDVAVAVNEELTFNTFQSLQGKIAGGYCRNIFRFVPEQGKQYAMTSAFADFANNCEWKFVEIEQNEERERELLSLDIKKGWGKDSSFCEENTVKEVKSNIRPNANVVTNYTHPNFGEVTSNSLDFIKDKDECENRVFSKGVIINNLETMNADDISTYLDDNRRFRVQSIMHMLMFGDSYNHPEKLAQKYKEAERVEKDVRECLSERSWKLKPQNNLKGEGAEN